MSKFVKFAIILALLCTLILTAIQQKDEGTTIDNQTRYAELINEVKPFLSRKNRPKRVTTDPLSGPVELTIAQAATPAVNSDFQAYRATLLGFQNRFKMIKPPALEYCQQDEYYRYLGALNQWGFWAEREALLEKAAEQLKAIKPGDTAERSHMLSALPLRNYESKALEFMGLPQSFAQIKARGEAEFRAISSELGALEAAVNAEFGQSLDEYAASPQHISRTDAQLIPRLETALGRIEDAFKDDFSFAHVPAGTVSTKPDYGPNYAIASYNRQKNAMIVYWQTGVYTHIYDTMLAVHEIMPGHHLQLKMSRAPLCTIGPVSTSTVFLEGWASYAETLAEEKGLFAAPDQRLGWLDYRLIRAMRIIMDTARIEDTLTEAKAMALWERRMPKRLHTLFPREWARINHSPHHLSYIFGADAIMAAKTHVKKEFGEEYDEAEFHQALLNSMHRSLEHLGPRMSAQILERRAQKARAEARQTPDP